MKIALLFSLAIATIACSAAQKAAAKDPMRCERDPSCAKSRDLGRDCSTQCNYDPACTDRCREMQGDGIGHK